MQQVREKEKYLILFGLDADFDHADLKEAYRVLSKVWHPDRFDRNEKMREKAEKTTKEVNQGYKFLKEDLKKRENLSYGSKARASGGQASAGQASGGATPGGSPPTPEKKHRPAYNKTPLFRPRSLFSWWLLIPFMILIFALPLMSIMLGEEEEEVQDRERAYLQHLFGLERNAADRSEGYSYFNLGMELCENAQYEQALEQIDKAIAHNPDFAKAYLFRGMISYRMDNDNYAIRDYTYAIDLDPDETFSYYGRGLVYKNSGRYKDAIADFDRAIRQESDVAELYVVRGQVKYTIEDYQGAIRDFSRAIEVDSDHSRAYAGRALARYTIRDYRNAGEDFTRAIELGEGNGSGLGLTFESGFGDLFFDRGPGD